MIDPVSTSPAMPPAIAGVCRGCGCTEADCRQCIEATGEPCSWVDEDRDLCSRCAAEIEMAALLATAAPPALDVRALPLGAIVPSPYQHRGKILEEHLADLVASIRAQGVLSPVTVRPVAGDGYELVYGERRWRASRIAGLATIPAIVRLMTDVEAAAACLDENLRRRDLEPMEESEGVCHLLRLMGDPEAVADRLGKSPGWVARRARLGDLVDEWRQAAADPTHNVSSWGAIHLEVIARLPPQLQREIWQSRQWHFRLNPTVAEVEKLTATFLRVLASAPWCLDDVALVPDAGACSVCPKRSGAEPLLFEDLQTRSGKTSDRCLDQKCWAAKAAATVALKEKGLLEEVGVDGFAALTTGYDDRGGRRAKPGSRARIVRITDMEPAKKGTAGALPVLHIDGDRAGHVDWMVAKAGHQRRGPAVDPGTGKIVPARMSLAARREALERRRLRLMADVLYVALGGRVVRKGNSDRTMTRQEADGLSAPTLSADNQLRLPTHEEVVALALAVGTRDRQFSIDGHYYGGVSAASRARVWQRFDAAVRPSAQVDLDLWEQVSDVLRQRLQTGIWPPNFDLKLYGEDVERVGTLLGVDLPVLRASVQEKLPDPKAWAAEAAAEAAKKMKKKTRKAAAA